MRLPNFIGIGAQKAATTWVFQCLSEHPEVCAPKKKEINFFRSEGDAEEYATYFNHCPESECCGEFSPRYLSSPHVPKRMAAVVPEAQLIVILRDPIARLASALVFNEAAGHRGHIQHVDIQDPNIQSDLKRGCYFSQLTRFLEYYTREQIHVMIYEDIEQDPRRELQKLFTFLGIASTFVPPSLNQRVNVTRKKRYHFPFIQHTYVRLMKSVGGSRYKHLLLRLIRTLRLNKLGRWLQQKNDTETKNAAKSSQRYQFSTEEKDTLINYYCKDTEQLEEFLGRKLPWQSSVSH